jgi:hypothetical protein
VELAEAVLAWFKEVFTSDKWLHSNTGYSAIFEGGMSLTDVATDITICQKPLRKGSARPVLVEYSFRDNGFQISGHGALTEFVSYEGNSLEFSKWGNNTVLSLEDPEFFPRLAFYVNHVTLILTMGGLAPLDCLVSKKTEVKDDAVDPIVQGNPG